MEIKILSKNFELTNEIERYIEAKINSINSKLGPLSPDEKRTCNFRIGKKSASRKTGNVYFAEANIVTAHKGYGAQAEAASVQEAIDELKDELSKKVRRYKDKKEGYIKKSGRATKNLLRKFMR